MIAMGATATVLAYNLALAGFQELDIGHIEMEYEWMPRMKSRLSQDFYDIPMHGSTSHCHSSHFLNSSSTFIIISELLHIKSEPSDVFPTKVRFAIAPSAPSGRQ